MPDLSVQDFKNLRTPQYGVVLGLPTLGSHRAEFTLALLQAGMPMNCVSQIIPILGRSVAEARNIIVHMAKIIGAKYVIFVDEDVIIPPNTLRKLLWDMDNNAHISVCGGIYVGKGEPVQPLVFDAPGMGPSYDWHVGDMHKCWAIGMGCTVIRVADLAKLDPICDTVIVENFPQVACNTEMISYFKDGSNYVYQPSQEGMGSTTGWTVILTEDIYFCGRCAEVGLQVFADCSINADHIASDGTRYILGMCRPTVGPVKPGDTVYLDLGCGPMYRKYEDGTPMLRVDIDPKVKPEYVQDVRKLSFLDSMADGVLLSHVLEHFNRHEAEIVLDEAVRVVKEGGWVCISVPDMKWITKWYEEHGNDNIVLRSIFGAQTDDLQYHKSGWDETSLRHAFERRGCEITVVKGDPDTGNLEVWAKKSQVKQEENKSE